MTFQLTLFRAPEGVGSLDTWDREHRELLGTKSEVRAALDRALPGLHWREHGGLWFAAGPFAGEDHAIEISLYGAPQEQLLDFRVYALPPAIRAVMTALELNHCFAMDSCSPRFPFEAGDRWPSATV